VLLLTLQICSPIRLLTNVDMGASAAGYTVHKIYRYAGKMIAIGGGAFRTSYTGERSDELAPRALTCM